MTTFVVYEVSAGKGSNVWAFARAEESGVPGFTDVTYFEPGGLEFAAGAEPDWAHVRYLFTYEVDPYAITAADDESVTLRRAPRNPHP